MYHSTSKGARYRSWQKKIKKYQKRLERALQSGRLHTWSKLKKYRLLRILKRYAQRLLHPLPKVEAQSGLKALALSTGLIAFSASATNVAETSPATEMPALSEMTTTPEVSLTVNTSFVTEDVGNSFFCTFTRTGSTVGDLVVRFTLDGDAIAGTDYTISGETAPNSRTVTIPNGQASTVLLITPLADSDIELDENVIVRIAYFALPNPLPFDFGQGASPHFADIDGDGDLDAFVGEKLGLTYYENRGNRFVPAFSLDDNSMPPGLSSNGYSYPDVDMEDIDSDGDLDALMGVFAGGTHYFENIGNSSAPSFSYVGHNPFGLTDVGYNTSPDFVDIDGDGDLDVFIGEYSGLVGYYKNTGNSTAPAFVDDLLIPFGITDVGDGASPTFADIDGDGDLDAFIGEVYGDVLYFENAGNSSAPSFFSVSSNPLGITNVGYVASPTFADIDGDGDLDAFIGNSVGNVVYFENNPSPYNASTTNNSVFCTILNDDSRTSITALSADQAEGNSSFTPFTFTVSRNGYTAGTASVTYAVTGEVDAADFGGTLPAGTISFAVNETSKTLTLQVSGDTDVEGDENFVVTLSNPTSGLLSETNSTANGRIENDDTNTLSVTLSPTSVLEDSGNNFAFTFTRIGGGTVGDLDVPFTLSGDAIAGADYTISGETTPNARTITILNGQSSAVLTISPTSDTEVELDENVILTIEEQLDPYSYDISATNGAATATIQNDDSKISIIALSSVKAEGNTSNTSFTFTLSRSGDTSGPASIQYAVTGEVDAADFGGTLPAATIFFAPNEASRMLTLSVSGDTDLEPDENFAVTLSNPTGVMLSATNSFALGTIENDDSIIVGVTVSPASAVEDSGNNLLFTFTRIGNTIGDLEVPFTLSGQTIAGTDYTISGESAPDSRNIIIPNGQASAVLTISPMTDTQAEFDETVILTVQERFVPDFSNASSVNPFQGIDFETYAVPVLEDLDGDDDLDALIENRNGVISYFENTGNSSNPAFGAASTNPFGLSFVGIYASPTFADLDADGDLDALIGEYFGRVFYFENTGNSTNPAFSAASSNPFGLLDVGYRATPTFADIDSDGDLDALIGDAFGDLAYFENTGNSSAPAFSSVGSNPFGLSNVGYHAIPNLVDIDGDGDLDALIGNRAGNVFYFENTGNSSVPAFKNAVSNPFGLSDVGYNSAPDFADLDGDGDLDVLIGESFGYVVYFENNQLSLYDISATEGTATGTILDDNSRISITALSAVKAEGNTGNTSFTFTISRSGDISGQASIQYAVTGDVDAADFGGTLPAGTIFLAPNQASIMLTLSVSGDTDLEPDENFAVTLSNPTGGVISAPNGFALGTIENDDTIIVGVTASPTSVVEDSGNNLLFTFTRIGNTIGDLEVPFTLSGQAIAGTDYTISGESAPDSRNIIIPNGQASAVLTISPMTDTQAELDETVILTVQERFVPDFSNASSANPFQGIDFETYAVPVLEDLDGDGDLDALIENRNGVISYFENTGNSSNPAFGAASTNPFGLSFVGIYASPTFADLDADGDLDALIGEYFGRVFYFENTGNSTNPAFSAASSNPFGLLDVGYRATPTFADIDSDGDLDALIGDAFGDLAYFENTGNSSAPAFSSVGSNPFGLSNVGYHAIPNLVDIDGDGDLDALIGNRAGNVFYFENTGNSSVPAFKNAISNPFGLSDVGYNSAPNFADLDGDGDLDALIGESFGYVVYFENNQLSLYDISATEGTATGTIQDNNALPLQLLLFVAKPIENQSQLLWKTATEEHLSGYVIEWQSEDADWKTIGFVAANNTPQAQYQYRHEQPRVGMNYYRLRIIEEDGSEEYSNIEAVDFEKEKGELLIYPNPNQGEAMVQLPDHFEAQQPIELQVYDVSGKMVYHSQLFGNKVLTLTHLPKGTYMLRLKQAAQVVEGRMVIQ